jgi:hypothetical protein
LNIGDRVRLELSSGAISVYPVSGRGRAVKAPEEQQENLVELYMDEDIAPEADPATLRARLHGIRQKLVRVRSKQTNVEESDGNR